MFCYCACNSDHKHEYESGMNKGGRVWKRDNDMKGMDEICDMKWIKWKG